MWPLSVSANGRYLQTADGTPFFSITEAAWSAIVQLTPAQMDQYVADCVSRGINGIITNLIENGFGTNKPNTIDNIAPFTTAGDFSTPNNTYFARADYLIQACKNAGIVVWLWPLYVGLQPTGDQGWSSQFGADTQAHRQAWGTFVGNRYKDFGNVILVHGGDGIPSNFSIVTDYVDALTSVWPNALHSYHASRNTSAYTAANSYSWLKINNTYIDGSAPASVALTEYGRTPARPVIFIEGTYETGSNASGVLNEIWQSLCSGCLAGVTYGNDGIWTFGSPGYDANFASHYGDTGRTYLQHIRTLLNAYQWWKLAPSTGTGLVTTSLGSGTSQICPMLADDASFAWIYSPAANFTLNRAAFAGAYSNIRIRSYNTLTGAFTTISASVPATGTQAITVSGQSVIVVDGA
jgi:hypothetical protein